VAIKQVPDVDALRRDTFATAVLFDRRFFFINGEPLDHIIERTLATSPDALAAWHKGGGFLRPRGTAASNYHYTEHPDHDAAGLEAAVFICNCDTQGCADVTVTIEVGEKTVVWHSFRLPQRKEPAPGLGPFVFDRRQYERVIGVTPSIPGLLETAWHLGTEDTATVEAQLRALIKGLMAAVVSRDFDVLRWGAHLPPDLDERGLTRRLDAHKTPLRMPPDDEFAYFRLEPLPVYNRQTDEVGTIAAELWDAAGPTGGELVATIFYDLDGPRLQLRDVRRA
jgi:hypothetical protein